MSKPTLYLEVDSTHRDRNSFPDISEFEIQVSQSGARTREKSLDPVCLSSPVEQWTGNQFNARAPGNSITVTVVSIPLTANMLVEYGTDNINLIVRATLSTTLLQKIKNYYLSATVRVQLSAGSLGPPVILPTYAYRNITYYEWLTTDGTYDYARIILSSGFQDSVLPLGNGVSIDIFEPSASTSLTISPPAFFVPNGYVGANCYYGLYMYNETNLEYRKIVNYDVSVNLAFLESPVNWNKSDNFSIRKELPFFTADITIPNLTTISCAQDTLSSEKDYYNQNFIRIIPKGINNVYGRNQYSPTGEMRRIIGYEINDSYSFSWVDSNGINVAPVQYIAYLSTINDYIYMIVVDTFLGAPGPFLIMSNFTRTIIKKYSGINVPIGSVASQVWNPTQWNSYITVPPVDPNTNISLSPSFLTYKSATFTITPPLSNFPSDSIHKIEMLNWSYDNSYDLNYSGALLSQPEMVCIELLNIILPNKTLNTQYGSRIAYYPYVYVELSNVSSGGSGLSNIIYSNNPNSSRMVFRACIDDMNHPLNSAFIKIDGDRMVQMMKFQANNTIRFRVTLPNGELFRVNDPEYFSPNEPNARNQITALFAIKRV